ncbi:unnamed protein product [Linum trigynum]|uniref:Uncharacterized protein n=1 Tax=Linum trigynum TaxID=586398 RepID=A0AAV2DXD6_9ROSI
MIAAEKTALEKAGEVISKTAAVGGAKENRAKVSTPQEESLRDGEMEDLTDNETLKVSFLNLAEAQFEQQVNATTAKEERCDDEDPAGGLGAATEDRRFPRADRGGG